MTHIGRCSCIRLRSVNVRLLENHRKQVMFYSNSAYYSRRRRKVIRISFRYNFTYRLCPPSLEEVFVPALPGLFSHSLTNAQYPGEATMTKRLQSSLLLGCAALLLFASATQA